VPLPAWLLAMTAGKLNMHSGRLNSHTPATP
jgi:hypothetical protein